MNRNFTQSEIQNVVRTAETIHKIKEKIEQRKEIELSTIEWYKKNKDLTPEQQIRSGRCDAFQFIYINKKHFIAGA